jgi:hypothetical protein
VARVRIEILLSAVLLITALLLVWKAPVPLQETVLKDIDGVDYGTLDRPAASKWSVLFFLMTDCPIANRYAPEIKRICLAYGSQGANCFLVYVDPATSVPAIREHLKDYQYALPAILDSQHTLVRKAGATVSSEAAVFSTTGQLEYRGRIDNFHAALGTPRQQVTEFDLRDALDALVAGRSVPNPRTQAIGCFIPEVRR